MSRLSTSFVLGYHGCDSKIANKAVNEGVPILQSNRNFDWLGPGAYFWEADPVRALEWAKWKSSRGDYDEPSVIGAVIDLRNCLDLTVREDIELVRYAYESFSKLQSAAGLPLPENKNAQDDPNGDRLLRYLDCAVLRHLHQTVEAAKLDPYDSVRGMFTEGGVLFDGSGLSKKTHTQIAVRSEDCIKGIFFPLENGSVQHLRAST